jgi:hypothetical protein
MARVIGTTALRMLGGVLMVIVAAFMTFLYAAHMQLGPDATVEALLLAAPVGALTGGWFLAPHLRRSAGEGFTYGLGAAIVGLIYFAVFYSLVKTLEDLMLGRYFTILDVLTQFFTTATNVVVHDLADVMLMPILFITCGLAGLIGVAMVRNLG